MRSLKKRNIHNLGKFLTNQIKFNSTVLSTKAYLKMICARRDEIVPYNYPLLIISGMQRSGTTMVTQLLSNHPSVLSYFAELHIGKPNKYHWPSLEVYNYKERFQRLIPRNLAYKFLSRKSNYDFIFDFSFFKKTFLNLEKYNIANTQRVTLDNFFTSYFNAYLNCNHSNFFDQYQFISASIPGLTLYQDSLNKFIRDYPDGKILVMIREPLIWWNSARRHSKSLKTKGIERYSASLNNSLWAIKRYPHNVFIVSFDQLVMDTKQSVDSFLSHLGIDFSEVAMYPSNFPFYGKDNSTYGHKSTKVVIKDKINRTVNIPKKEEEQINRSIYPDYKIAMDHAINNFSRS